MDAAHVPLSTRVGQLLLSSRVAKLAEIGAVMLIAVAVIGGLYPLVGENPVARLGVVWLANILMMLAVWTGLRLRGQTLAHFGLPLRGVSVRELGRAFLLSLVVFVGAIAAFMVGAVVMANLVGMPEGADMSRYNYLSGNPPMLLVSLAGVYVASSFGEELLYRGFLMSRLAELGSGGRASWAVALVVSSIVFGLIHSEWSIAGVVQTGLMGAALGGFYLAWGRNLWIIVLAHTYADTLLLVQLYAA